eukprot:77010-Ditylum_brightwellii.AAC.1
MAPRNSQAPLTTLTYHQKSSKQYFKAPAQRRATFKFLSINTSPFQLCAKANSNNCALCSGWIEGLLGE